MAKINTAHILVNLAGESLINKDTGNPVTLGEALSNILLMEPKGGKMRNFLLAKQCYEKKEMEFSTPDLAMIKKSVEDSQQELYNNLITGQILEILEAIK